MRKLFILFAVLLVGCAVRPNFSGRRSSVNQPGPYGTTGRDDSNTANSLSNLNPALGTYGGGAYPLQLYNSLSQEDANRWFEQGFGNFVSTTANTNSCLGGTSGGLTMTPTSCIAYNAGFRGTETGSITFSSNITTWVAMDENTTGNNANLPNFTRVASTHYLIDSIDAGQPLMAPDSQLLMKVVTSTAAITAVTDLRATKPIAGTRDILVTAPPFNAKCNGTTDDTNAIQAAWNAAQAIPYPEPRLVFPAGVCVVTASHGWLNFTGHSNWEMVGAGHRGTVIVCKASSANIGTCVDMAGDNSTTIRDINFQGGTSNADAPHVILLQGKTLSSPAVSNNLEDVQFQPFYGDYALFNYGAENSTYLNPYFQCSNTSGSGHSCVAGAVFSSCNNAAITSVFTTLATPPVSMSEVSLYGHESNFTLGNSAFGVQLDDNCVGSAIAQIDFDHAYFNDASRNVIANPSGFGVGFTSTAPGPSSIEINLNDVRMESFVTGAFLFGGANAKCTNCTVTGYWAPVDNLTHAIALNSMVQSRISLMPFNAANPIFIGAVSDLGTVVTLMGGETKASFTGSDFIFINANASSPVNLQSNELGMGKLSGTPPPPAAGACFFFSVAGTNAGSCKIQALCGTSVTPVLVVDNVGTGC